MSLEERLTWEDGFLRTLVEAVRQAAVRLLEVEEREISGTARLWRFGYPEIVLYDAVAGYCQMLIERGLRALLERSVRVLECPAHCLFSPDPLASPDLAGAGTFREAGERVSRGMDATHFT